MSAVILAIIGKLTGSAGLGTLVGLIGSYVQKRQDLKHLELSQKHELAMRDKDAELAKLEIAGAATLANIKKEETTAIADAEMQAVSYAADKATYSTHVMFPSDSKWGQFGNTLAGLLLFGIDVLRGSVRPIATYYLIIFLSWMVWTFLSEVPLRELMELNADLFWQVFEYTLTTAVFLASTAVAWWFGARAKKLD